MHIQMITILNPIDVIHVGLITIMVGEKQKKKWRKIGKKRIRREVKVEIDREMKGVIWVKL